MPFQHAVERMLPEPLRVLTLQRLAGLVRGQARRHVRDVGATVAVLGKRPRDSRLLGEARRHRRREQVHLIAGVVDEELALGPVPRGAQQPHQCGAHRRGARIHDVQRSGGIGAHVLHLDRRGVGMVVASELVARGTDALGQRRHERGRIAEVDEPGARHLDRLEQRRIARKRRGQLLRQRPRRLPELARQ